MQTSLARWLIPKTVNDSIQLTSSNDGTITATRTADQDALPPQESIETKPSTANAAHSVTPSLHKNISLECCTETTLAGLKRLNTLLPISYPQKFYTEILTDPIVNTISLVAIWNESSDSEDRKVIGGIRCRLLPDIPRPDIRTASKPGHQVLYISTLVVSPPFRTTGVATALLAAVTTRAIELGARRVGAHVWVANEEGRKWYSARGFTETRTEEGYYRRLEPQGAVVVERRIGVLDHLTMHEGR